MHRTVARLHGALRFPVGSSSLRIGAEIQPMIPSNQIFYDAAKLRHRLDQDGYLYFKNIIPASVIGSALDDVASQMLQCEWTSAADREAQAERHGFALGVPFPGCGSSGDVVSSTLLKPPSFSLTNSVRTAASGSTVMATVRQVYGGNVEVLPHFTLDFSPPHERHGFRMGSVFMNRGTKLALIAWVPLHDTTLSQGGLCVVRGSNTAPAYARIRETYGAVDVETAGIHGDGCYTHDPAELLPLGKRGAVDPETGAALVVDDTPLVTTSFEVGDVVLMTVYTMYGFLTNQTDCWRISAETKWIMEGDDVGPDPRYCGTNPVGLRDWLASRDDVTKYPRTMLDAKREWGLITTSQRE